MVGSVARQIADFLHPVTAPRAGIEVGYDAKRTASGLRDGGTTQISADRFGRVRLIGVEQEINFRQKQFLQAIRRAPPREESAFVFCCEIVPSEKKLLHTVYIVSIVTQLLLPGEKTKVYPVSNHPLGHFSVNLPQ